MQTLMRFPVLVAATAALAACDGGSTSPKGEQPVAIAFSAVGNRSTTAADSSTNVGDSIIVTKVQVVMSELELARTAGDSLCTAPATTSNSESGSSSSSDDKKKKEEEKKRAEERRQRCPQIELGPFLVNLPLSSSTTTRFANNIPAGVYREIEFKIDKPETDSSGVAFLATNPDFRDISVRAEGTFKGKAFTFTGRAKAELELEFKPSLTVQATGTVVNIQVDLKQWFRNSAGVAVDPASANPGGVNASMVARNIGKSFSLVAN